MNIGDGETFKTQKDVYMNEWLTERPSRKLRSDDTGFVDIEGGFFCLWTTQQWLW